MTRIRVLLSEASSLSAREFVTVLGHSGVEVEVASAETFPIARFSKWCRAVNRVPPPSDDPFGYLRAVNRLMASGRFDALIPTHEQTWMFAVGRRYLPHSHVAVAASESFDQVESKLEFARLLDQLGVAQPGWRPLLDPRDLNGLGFPVWIKTAYSTAGRGVRLVDNYGEAIAAWRELCGAGARGAMIQEPAVGTYAQVQGLFDRGRLFAAAVSERVSVGAGGSAAARLSADHPFAVEAIARLGAHLNWHGGLTLDYFHQHGSAQFIECNPRIVEPGNAAAAGVNLPLLIIDLSTGQPLPSEPVVTRPGVRTKSTMAIAIGAAETGGTRRAIIRALAIALLRRPPLQTSCEVLTPVFRDFPSLIPLLYAILNVLARPANVARLAGAAVNAYSVTPDAVQRIRDNEIQ